MGRYLIGSAEFDYRYIYGEQPRNLAYLARASGVGECRLRVLLHPLRSVQETDDLPPTESGLVPYATLAEHGGARGLRFDGPYLIIPEPGDPIRFLESLEESLADDARLLERLERTRLSGARAYVRAAYRLPRVGWPLLLAWINSHLADEGAILRLEQLVEPGLQPGGGVLLEGPLEQALSALRGRDTGSGSMEAFLPLTALHILRHAVAHGLEEMWVEEADEGWDLLLWRRVPQDEPIAVLTAQLEHAPRSAAVRLSRAVAWARRDRLRLADDDALQALALRPADPVARAAFGLLAAARGRHRDAFDALLAVSRAPARRGDLRDLAPLMEAVDGAVRARYPRVPVRDAQRLPDLPRAATALALALHDAVVDLPTPRRMEILSRHLDLHPHDVERRAERCELLLRVLRPRDALLGASLPGVDTPRLARVRAAAHLACGRPEEALAVLDTRMSPEDISLRAAALEAAHRPEEALAVLSARLPAADVSLEDLARAARLLVARGDAPAAEGLLERLLRRSGQSRAPSPQIAQALSALPQTERVHRACVRFWTMRGEPERALSALQALDLAAPDVLRASAEALLALGRSGEACLLLESALEAHPALEPLWLRAAAETELPCPPARLCALERALTPGCPRAERARLHRWCAQLWAAEADPWAAARHLEASLALDYTAETLACQARLLASETPSLAAESQQAARRLSR